MDCKRSPIVTNRCVPSSWIKNLESNLTDLYLRKCLECKWDPILRNCSGQSIWIESWNPTWRTCICTNIWNASGSNSKELSGLNLHKHFELKWVPILRNDSGLNSWIESWRPIWLSCTWTNELQVSSSSQDLPRPKPLNWKLESSSKDLQLHKQLKYKWVPIQRNCCGPIVWIESWSPSWRTCICANIWNASEIRFSDTAAAKAFELNVGIQHDGPASAQIFEMQLVPILRNWAAWICTSTSNSSGFQF